MRVLLTQVLQEGSPNDLNQVRKLRTITRKSGDEAIKSQIDAYASAVRSILEDLPSLYIKYFQN